MLATGFIYALKSALILSLLYGGYLLLFQNNSHHRLKRGILIGIVLSSLALPLIQLEVNHTALPPVPNIEKVSALVPAQQNSLAANKTTVSPQEHSVAGSTSTKSRWAVLLVKVYGLGVLVSLLLFIRQLGQIVYLILFAQNRHDLGRLVVSHRFIKFPFSFWKWTFLPADFSYDQATWKIVDRHELAHQEQGHTLDLVLVSLVRCLLWFNPVIYLLQSSVKENHEYLADQSVLTMHSMEEYSQALLAVCLNSPSLDLTHSFSLKSNLSKRIKNMNRQRTSRLRSGVALTVFMSIVMLVVTQVSLYAQQDVLEILDKRLNAMSTYDADNPRAHFSSYKVYEKTGQDPDQWVFLDKNVFPLVLLEAHKSILEDYKKKARTDIEGQLDYSMRLLLGKTNDAEAANPFRHPLSEGKTELSIRLTVDQRIAMYQLAKNWTEKYTHQVYPEHQLISELEFMENEYLFFVSEPSRVDPRKYGINTTFGADEVEVQPVPFGGMERFLKNVIKYSQMDSSLRLSDLPEKIEFEFTIDAGGNLVMLKPATKVTGDEEVADKVYAWLGQLNKNLIRVSEVYLWKPGKKEGSKVATRMRLEIPKHLL